MWKPKFTPGPWKVKEFHGNFSDLFEIQDAKGYGIARLYSNIGHNDNPETLKANAILMSYAPVMYELLRKMDVMFGVVYDTGEDPLCDDCDGYLLSDRDPNKPLTCCFWGQLKEEVPDLLHRIKEDKFPEPTPMEDKTDE